MTIEPSLKWLLAGVMLVYLVLMYGISLIAFRRIHSVEDYVVAGRRLSFSFAWMTLLATWFGAGTILAVADEVRSEGLRAMALDPLGAGCCLIFAGVFVAGPMWRMKLLTVSDFFRVKFGPSSELLSALILVPSYFGWIAAQFRALAEVLELFFDVPLWFGLLLVALVGTGYTLIGGMWSVTLTDAAQISLVLGGLIVLLVVVLLELGRGSVPGGWDRLLRDSDRDLLTIIPTSGLAVFVGWLGVFVTGALGNVPGQDLMQRVFAARSSVVAQRACVFAGCVYLVFGMIPPLLALAANILFPESTEAAILPALARGFLHPVVAVLFLLALLSAVLSTIDSAILSPASVLSQNIFGRVASGNFLRTNRLSVLIVALASLVLAYVGESAYSLLEEAYALTLVGLFVPLMIGVYSSPRSHRAANLSMLVGAGLWAIHLCLGWESLLQGMTVFQRLAVPVSLSATVLAMIAYFCVERPWRIRWIKP